MKKIILLAVFAALSSAVFAQESLSEFLDAINDINNNNMNHLYNTKCHIAHNLCNPDIVSREWIVITACMCALNSAWAVTYTMSITTGHLNQSLILIKLG